MPTRECYCPACGQSIDDFVVGGALGDRPRAGCPRCGSLERHRLLALLLDGLAPVVAAARVVLDVAPVPIISDLLRRRVTGLYLPTDFDPAADGRHVTVRADLAGLPLRDGAVDLMVCLQVLEHVPDDAAAMREIHRVLTPGGLALMNVPFRPGTVTDEDPSAPPEERVRRFGQADHVRFYGDDFNDRLHAADLGFVTATSLDLFGPDLTYRLGLSAPEPMWFVWRGAQRRVAIEDWFGTLRALAAPAPVRGAGRWIRRSAAVHRST